MSGSPIDCEPLKGKALDFIPDPYFLAWWLDSAEG